MEWNPFKVWHDSKERKELKAKIAGLFTQLFYRYGPTTIIDLKDIDISGMAGKHDPKAQMLVLGIVRELCAEHKEWSIIDFGKDFGVTQTSSLVGMPKRDRERNTEQGVIILGGDRERLLGED